jgi:hypothetical protein
MCKCVKLCIHMYIYVYSHTYMCICTYKHKHIHICVHTHACECHLSMDGFIHIYTYVYIYVYTCMHVCVTYLSMYGGGGWGAHGMAHRPLKLFTVRLHNSIWYIYMVYITWGGTIKAIYE